MNAFQSRGYPKNTLNEAFKKLNLLNRQDLLKPKSNLVIKSLAKYNPNVLEKYNISINYIPNERSNDNVYIIFPFYKYMYNIKKVLISFLQQEIEKGQNSMYKQAILNLNLIISFKKINCLKDFCKIRR